MGRENRTKWEIWSKSHKWIRATSVRTSNQDNGPDTYPGSGCGQIPVFTFFNHSRSLLGFALFPASFVPLSRQISQEPIRDTTKNGRANPTTNFTISMLGLQFLQTLYIHTNNFDFFLQLNLFQFYKIQCV